MDVIFQSNGENDNTGNYYRANYDSESCNSDRCDNDRGDMDDDNDSGSDNSEKTIVIKCDIGRAL